MIFLVPATCEWVMSWHSMLNVYLNFNHWWVIWLIWACMWLILSWYSTHCCAIHVRPQTHGWQPAICIRLWGQRWGHPSGCNAGQDQQLQSIHRPPVSCSSHSSPLDVPPNPSEHWTLIEHWKCCWKAHTHCSSPGNPCWMVGMLIHGLCSGNLQGEFFIPSISLLIDALTVHHSSGSILPHSWSLSPTWLPLLSTWWRDLPVPHLQNRPMRMVSNLHGPSIVSPSLTESDPQATEIDGVFYLKEVVCNVTWGAYGKCKCFCWTGNVCDTCNHQWSMTGLTQ